MTDKVCVTWLISMPCPVLYQVRDLVHELVDLLAVDQPDVALAQQTADLLPNVALVHLKSEA